MRCEEVKSLMAEYIDDTLDAETREEVAGHLDICDGCFNEIKALDKTMWSLEESSRNITVPPDFLDSVEERAVKECKPAFKNIKKFLRAAVYAAICAAAAGVVFWGVRSMPKIVRYRIINAAAPGKVYSREYGTFGRKLNISSTDNGIKITATKVVADDIQTSIYFKVDSAGSFLPAADGLLIDEGTNKQQAQYFFSDTLGYNTGEFVVHAEPFNERYKNLHVSITSLNSLNGDWSIKQSVSGSWKFTIPYERMNSKSYDINASVDLDGNGIEFKKFISAPSGSYITYIYKDVNNHNYNYEQMPMLDNANLRSGQKTYGHVKRMDIFANSMLKEGPLFLFESLYPEKPKDIKLNIISYIKSTAGEGAEKRIPIDLDGPFPVVFEYLGNRLSVNKLESSDRLIQLELTEPKCVRNYIYLHYGFDEIDEGIPLTAVNVEDCYVVDENNIEHDYNEVLNDYQKYEGTDLTVYPVKTVFGIRPPSDSKSKREFTLDIEGYTCLKKVNKTVDLNLK